MTLRSGHLPEFGYWTYIVLGLLVLIEGPIATLLGAAAASAGLMRPWAVFLAAAIGNLSRGLAVVHGGIPGEDEMDHAVRAQVRGA